ncbi:hypothetical protein ACIP5N_21720 [Streptomyces sp. NPDC088768]|uniref:hypothetical protein n=1 Tax=Streptomyces sp. NPDC088768 TaxID=3365894 RepID=UPI003804E9C5
MTTTPNSCRRCGIDHREHAQRWTAAAKRHQRTPPTQQQIKARRRARRARTGRRP